MATIVLIALLLSGTRANSALALVTFSIGFLTSEQNTKSIKTIKRKIILVLILVIVGSYVLIAQGLWDRYLEFYISKVGSDEVRAKTLPSIFNVWKNNPLSFIIGQGYTGVFFDKARYAWVSDVELSYWNMIRRVGFLCFIVFMYCLIMPIIKMRQNKAHIAVITSYVAYLIGCYVNPLLYTSTGVTVMLFAYVYAYLPRYEKL